MSETTKKKLIITGVIAALFVVFFPIYWTVAERNRGIKRNIEYVQEEILNYRSGESSNIDFLVSSDAMVDSTYIDFLSTQISEMIDNAEYELLGEFLEELENENAYISELKDDVINLFNSVAEVAFAIKDKELDYYNVDFDLSRDSSIVATYIESNGIEKISTTPGTGYYADEIDKSNYHRVGLERSPLYEATSTTYRGDFEIRSEYGVKLNSLYEETSYSHTAYSFRGNDISFSPDDGECIYSGDYLFCFSSDGTLIDLSKIN